MERGGVGVDDQGGAGVVGKGLELGGTDSLSRVVQHVARDLALAPPDHPGGDRLLEERRTTGVGDLALEPIDPAEARRLHPPHDRDE